MTKKKNKKIILSGGGTGGSVSPLLALYDFAQEAELTYDFSWVGTSRGIERKMVKEEGIKYIPILSGKFRRYFSLKNFLDVFKIIGAFFQSLSLIIKEKPSLILSAGGFVSVPLVWAGCILRVPIIIHQQDVRPGLANILMAKCAKKITVTFKKSLEDYGAKASLTGNPIRKYFKKEYNLSELKQEYSLNSQFPIILILGGGGGAKAINDFVYNNLENLTANYQIIHITGKNKKKNINSQNYQAFEFLPPSKIAKLMYLADTVMSRAGLGFLSEFSHLKKPVILIPIPNTHQEENAKFLEENKAALILSQEKLSLENTKEAVKKTLEEQETFKNNIYNLFQQNSGEKIWQIIEKHLR